MTLYRWAQIEIARFQSVTHASVQAKTGRIRAAHTLFRCVPLFFFSHINYGQFAKILKNRHQ
jgi:hypothetical protein